MASLDFLAARHYAAEGKSGRVLDDKPVALRISHPGTEAVTSVTVVTAASLTLIDADGTTAIDLTAAATNTVGEVCDYINTLANWKCKVLDALRDDSVASSQLVDGAITSAVINGERVWDCLVDTSVALCYTYRVTYDRNVQINRPKGAHRVKLQEVKYYANVNAASANAVRIYEWDAVNKTETQVWGAPSVDATETTHTFASGEGMITAGEGNDLIVRVLDGTSLTDSTSGYLQCVYIRE